MARRRSGGASRKTSQSVGVGYALVGLAIAVVAFGGALVHGARWVIGAILAWAGLTLIGRVRGWRVKRRRRRLASGPPRPRVRQLKQGESYQDAVKLAHVPNLPLAEVWCQRLRQNGIEAFYKGAAPFGGAGIATLSPARPIELWVGEHDAALALQLFPELRS